MTPSPRAVKNLALALDDPPTRQAAFKLLRQFAGTAGTVKLHTAFLKYHVPLLKRAQELGYKTWADFKIFDTSETAQLMTKVLRDLGFDMITIHLSGGPKMIESVLSASGSMRVYGITVPTDSSQEVLNKNLGIPGTVLERVLYLMRLGIKHGVRGFVCSAKEVGEAVQEFGRKNIALATPGLRFRGEAHDEQKRVATPYEATILGADLCVMGRSLVRGGLVAGHRALLDIDRGFRDRVCE